MFKCVILSLTINLISVLLFVLVGGILPLIERKFLSLIQRRVGPKFIGFNGRFQFLVDAIKILLKEIIHIKSLNSITLVVLPIVALYLNIFILFFIFFFNETIIFVVEYSIITLLVCEILSKTILVIVGFASSNKYTNLSVTRILNLLIISEFFCSVIFCFFYLFTNSLDINNVFYYFLQIKASVVVPIAPFFFLFVLLILSKPPFDVIEAETELIMGPITEQSGFFAAVFILLEYIHLFFWCYILVNLFV